jgi:hypothetical protein
MKVRIPSLATLIFYLHRQCTASVINDIRETLKKCKAGKLSPESALRIIDQRLNNHGVESSGFRVKGKRRALHYSNSGDTYRATVMYWDIWDGARRTIIFMAGDWGTIAEKYPEA